MNRALVWRTIQNSTWLVGGLVLLGIAFFLWIGIQVHQRIVVEKPVNQGDVPIEPEKVRFSSTLGMMTDVVPPLDLSQTTISSTHTAEFRGADYVKAQSNRWYLHVMNVTKAEVIKSYLANRADRSKFTYFRYLEPKQSERYILAYGSFATVSNALDASKNVQFDLPDSVKVYPERFSELKKFVNDEVATSLEITNLGAANRLYQVKLRSVPVPVEQPAQTASSTNNTDSSTEQPSTITNPLGSTPGNNGLGAGSNNATNTLPTISGGTVTNVPSNTSANTPSNSASGNTGQAATQSALTGGQPSGRANQSSSGLPAFNSQTTPANNTSTARPKSQPVPAKATSKGTNSTPSANDATTETSRSIADPFN